MPSVRFHGSVASPSQLLHRHPARDLYTWLRVSHSTQRRSISQPLFAPRQPSQSFKPEPSSKTAVEFPRTQRILNQKTPEALFLTHATIVSRPSTRHIHYEQKDLGGREELFYISRSRSSLQQSGVGGWTSLVAVGLFSTVYLVYISSFELSPSETLEGSSETFKTTISDLQSWRSMTGEALPGRPGTLTVEQEEKLREFWIATLQVFGVLDNSPTKEVSPNGTDLLISTAPAPTAATTAEKPKKKRNLLFGKKKDTDNESATSGQSSPNPASSEDDKYGQTKQFHDALTSQSPEVLRSTFWSMVKHDHPDALLLRFLRARKWDVEKALIMMVSTMNWRASEMHVDDDIMKHGEESSLKDTKGADVAAKKLGEDFLTQLRMGKSFLHGTDRQGRPMCFVRVRLHKQGEQSEQSLERYTIFVIESARMILSPPIDTACVVFDMTGFSLANMDYSPVKFMIKCFEANYPESLGVVLVHKAPWVFQGVWKIIKGWLDPVVASKVNFTNNVTEMEEFVEKSHIIKDLGGDEDWNYQYIEPVAGENDRMSDTETKDKLIAGREIIVKAYEKATLDWIENNAAPNISDIKAKRHTLATELKEDYWRLDPYIRARSFYDRSGMIQQGGKLQFYPDKPIAAQNSGQEVQTSTDDLD